MSDETTPGIHVSELVGSEGGTWTVTTAHSVYVFDLDAMIVTRHPGATASSTVNDVPRPIRTIDVCRVGACGRWTMHAEAFAPMLDYYWQISTPVRTICQLIRPPDEAHDERDMGL